jgi:prolyl-tRNA synthetase
LRLSKLFGRTLREVPADAETVSHQLSLRAALVRQISTGIYSYLPLAWRVLKKIEQIMREEMDAIGGQDMMMPVVHPAEIWQATNRWNEIGPELARFKDRNRRDMVLAMTHEEVVAHLLRTEINSYRQLPVMFYHIQTKFRDEPRSRGGLIRAREFTMKDAYSCHASEEDMDRFYPSMYQAYVNIFRRCGLETVTVEADSGIMGGSASHEFMVLSEAGEDTLIRCSACDYQANAERAAFVKPVYTAQQCRDQGCEELPVEEVATPDCKTIQELADYLGVATHQTLKAVFYATWSQIIFAIIRGDLEVNETKLSKALGAPPDLHVATEEELAEAGIVAGYASPVGLKFAVSGVKVVADDSIQMGVNFVAGANKEGYHCKNVNYPRDFSVDILTDIALARAGDACPQCSGPLTVARGIEVGHLFKLGTKYSEGAGATFLDKDGQAKPIVMGSYGIGTGRLMAAVIEQNHDEKGIIWPLSIAPYHIHLMSLGTGDAKVVEKAEELCADLQARGYEVLYDDRDESAGVKFNDADLIGIPLRLTISARNLKQNGVEAKLRWEEKAEIVPLEGLYERINAFLRAQGHDAVHLRDQGL